MKRVMAFLLAAMMPVLLAACGGEAPEVNPTAGTTTTTEANVLDKTKEYRVLMIGNSYTYYNDLWDMVRDAAASAGYTFTVDHVTQGGYYLDQHANPEDQFGAEIEAKLAENKYDYVFLQEQSTNAILNYDRFAAGAKALDDKVKENGAETVLYETWARKEGCVTLTNYGWTVAGMTVDMMAAYERLGEELGATVSPVGAVFYNVVTTYPAIELYDPDGSHPSLAGSYAAALCHVVTLTGVNVDSITYDAGLDAETVAAIKQAVNAVAEA